jgi:hypothetical protein
LWFAMPSNNRDGDVRSESSRGSGLVAEQRRGWIGCSVREGIRATLRLPWNIHERGGVKGMRLGGELAHTTLWFAAPGTGCPLLVEPEREPGAQGAQGEA